MIGLVMLMGLVTKNAILLVDFANHGAQGRRCRCAEALLQAGLIRMRPIIMTTAAMVFGMLPLALALNDGGEIQAPMGRAIIGGVITSTLLTLVVVPVLYSYLVRERKPRRRAGAGAGAQPARAQPASRAALGARMPAAKDVAAPAPRSLRDVDHVAHDRVDLVLPAPAAEDAVVADARLHVVRAQVGPQAAAQVLRRQRLADRADVVALAFDRQQRGAPDRRRVDACGRDTSARRAAARSPGTQPHRLEVELGRQVGDREVLLVEGARDARPSRARRRRGAA